MTCLSPSVSFGGPATIAAPSSYVGTASMRPRFGGAANSNYRTARNGVSATCRSSSRAHLLRLVDRHVELQGKPRDDVRPSARRAGDLDRTAQCLDSVAEADE